MDEVEKLKDEIALLKKKLSKKCTRVEELNKKIARYKRLEQDHNDGRSYWFDEARKYHFLKEVMEHHWYRVHYKARSKGGGLLEYSDKVKSIHSMLAEFKVRHKSYQDYELIRIEKIS